MASVELFMKYLPASATEEEILAHYHKGAPSLSKVRLSWDRQTGECKGIGWLTLGDEADVTKLLNDWNKPPHSSIGGKNVELSRVAEKGATGVWKPNQKQLTAMGGTGFKCKFGAMCKRADCTFQHPDGWDPEAIKTSQGSDRFARMCNFGENCSRADCLFQHPEGRKGLQEAIGWKIRNCKIGRNCTFGPCIYTHPDGREFDEDAVPSQPKMGKKKTDPEKTEAAEAAAPARKKKKHAIGTESAAVNAEEDVAPTPRKRKHKLNDDLEVEVEVSSVQMKSKKQRVDAGGTLEKLKTKKKLAAAAAAAFTEGSPAETANADAEAAIEDTPARETKSKNACISDAAAEETTPAEEAKSARNKKVAVPPKVADEEDAAEKGKAKKKLKRRVCGASA